MDPDRGSPTETDTDDKGDRVSEAMGDELLDARPYFKTSLCHFFIKGHCKQEQNCNYAHGEEELRLRPDGRWDPQSKKGKPQTPRATDSNPPHGERVSHNVGDSVMEPVSGLLEVDSEETKQDSISSLNEEKGRDLNPIQQEPTRDDGLSDSLNQSLSFCVLRLPSWWKSDDFRKFLDKMAIKFSSAKKSKGSRNGFVNFGCVESLKSAKEKIDSYCLHGSTLSVGPLHSRSNVSRNETEKGGKILENNGDYIDSGHDQNEDINDDELEPAISKQDSDSKKVEKDVCECVTPLAKYSYEEQLQIKKIKMMEELRKLVRKTRKCCVRGSMLPDWIYCSKKYDGLPGEFLGIIPSPNVDHYRNKSEFTVGFDEHGNKTVGFQIGLFKDGFITVSDPSKCKNISKLSLIYSKLFETFIGTSRLPLWDKKENKGFWRLFTVREGRFPNSEREAKFYSNTELVTASDHDWVNEIKEVMLLIQINPKAVSQEEKELELKRVTNFFLSSSKTNVPPLPLTAITIQEHSGISNSANSDCNIYGLNLGFEVIAPEKEYVSSIHERNDDKMNFDNVNHNVDNENGSNGTVDGIIKNGDSVVLHDPKMYIHDYLFDLKFRISPTAFFQVNSLCAEKLYSLAKDFAVLQKNTLLFDICCGTGTISLALSKYVSFVIGIEMNENAVNDAKVNAKLNNIENCLFIAAKAEDVLESLMKQFLGKKEATLHSELLPNEEQKNEEPSSLNKVELKQKNLNVRVNPEESDAQIEGKSTCSETISNPSQAFSLTEEIAITRNDDVPIQSTESFAALNSEENWEPERKKIRLENESDVGSFSESKSKSQEEDGNRLIRKDDIETGGLNIGLPQIRSENEIQQHKSKNETNAVDEFPNKEKQTAKGRVIKSNKMEKLLEKTVNLNELEFSDVVAIVDPPRSGLHPTVLKTLRVHSQLRRLIYISCNVETLVANAVELCTPIHSAPSSDSRKNFPGWKNFNITGLAQNKQHLKKMPPSEAFKPVKAMAVDMFPHTHHCEVIMLFER